MKFDHSSGELKTVPAYWLTNVVNTKPFPSISLVNTYHDNKENYPKFDMFNAICVDGMNDISYDYYGVMGVPVTILSKDWMSEFEIVTFKKTKDGREVIYSITDDKISDETYLDNGDDLSPTMSCEGILNDGKSNTVNGKGKFGRILIRRRPAGYKLKVLKQEVLDISTNFLSVRKETLDVIENMRRIFNKKLTDAELDAKSSLLYKLKSVISDNGGRVQINEVERIDYIGLECRDTGEVAVLHSSVDNSGFILFTRDM